MRIPGILLLIFSLVACHKPSPNTIIVGTMAGPETELVETAKEVAYKKYGLKVSIVEFSDYNLPNEALQDGSLDANVYQHLPYLQAASKAHGYTLEAIGKTFVYPTAVYSRSIKSLAELPQEATIAIPNDPTNETRALLLLQKAGLIGLNSAETATVNNIVVNPKHLNIKELDAGQLPRVLDDVDAAVINTTFAIPAGLSPARDAIYSESKDSIYANLIVVRRDSTKKEQLIKLVKALNSEEVKQKAQSLFGDSAIPAWQ